MVYFVLKLYRYIQICFLSQCRRHFHQIVSEGMEVNLTRLVTKISFIRQPVALVRHASGSAGRNLQNRMFVYNWHQVASLNPRQLLLRDTQRLAWNIYRIRNSKLHPG